MVFLNGSKLAIFILCIFLVNSGIYGQASALTKNTLTTMTLNNLPGVVATSSTFVGVEEFQNKDNVTDITTTNFSHYVVPGLLGDAWIEVKDNNAVGDPFPTGSYVGVEVNENALLSVLGNFTVELYRDGQSSPVQTKSSANLISTVLGGGKLQIGFLCTAEFDRVRLHYTALIAAGNIQVFNFLVQKFGSNITPPCNTIDPLSNPNYSTAIRTDHTGTDGVTLSRINNVENLVSPSSGDFAVLTPGILAVLTQTSVAVQSQVGDFTGSKFVGFEFSNSSVLGLNLLSYITIRTYIDGGNTAVETASGSDLVLAASILSSSDQQKVGFIASQPFDEVRITFTIPIGVDLGTTNIYYAFIEDFCAATVPPACNAYTSLNNPEYPTAINPDRTGTTGIYLSNWSNTYNVVSPSTSDYAVLMPGVLSAATTSSLSVKLMAEDSIAGPKLVGFELQNTGLLGLDLASKITLRTYNDGVPSESASGSDLVLSLGLLQSSDRQLVTFLAENDFDEIQIEFETLADVNLGETRIYRAVIREFCTAELPDCNTMTALNETTQPVFVNALTSLPDGLACVACVLTDLDKIIDGNPLTYGRVDITAAVGAEASVSIKNALDEYPANTFAGFNIEYNELVDLDVATGIKIEMYNNNSLVHSSSNPKLLVGVGTSLLTGLIRETIGIVSPVAFDEVRIIFETVADVSLGEVKLYDFVIQHNCENDLDCNQTYSLSAPDFPVVIDFEKTGTSGGVCAACEIDNAWRVVDDNPSNYARINSAVSAIVRNELAIKDPVNTFYPGTYVGFSIKKNSFPVALALIDHIEIRTYNNGQLQEVADDSRLLDLTLLVVNVSLGHPAGDFFNIGFEATLPFDEVSISYVDLVSGLDTYLDVYGAFIDNSKAIFTGGANPTFCMKTNPDFNVGLINHEINGDVSTNDIISDGPGEYSDPVADPGNPSSVNIDLNDDGTYSFTVSDPGVYTFYVTVCSASPRPACRIEPLVITVKVPNGVNNPTANTDIIYTQGSDITPQSVTIHVLENDRPGNDGGMLNTPTISEAPVNGSAIVDPGDGTISYTPSQRFYGVDSLEYNVTESPATPGSANAKVYITVLPGDLVNTTSAADDYIFGVPGQILSGNVAANDSDPEGDSLTVESYSLSLAEGTITMASNGDYTFEPAGNFTGSIDFTYTICDNHTPAACANATLHVVINEKGVNLSPTISFIPNTIIGVQTISVVGRVFEFNNVTTSGTVTVNILKDPDYVLSFNSSAMIVGGIPVNNSIWTFNDTNPFFYVLTTNQPIAGGGVVRFGLTGTAGSTTSVGSKVINMFILDHSGGEPTISNTDNSDNDTLIFTY